MAQQIRALSIFEFKSYRNYLNDWIDRNAKGERGLKSKMAKAAECQISYLSRVLAAKSDLSIDQADLISTFIGHTESEAEYFILLVQFERATRNSLKKRLQRRMSEISNHQMAVGERLSIKATLSPKDQVAYYKHWYHAAIHILVSCLQFQTRKSLAERLRLSIVTISKSLEFLCATGLIVLRKDGSYSIGQTRLHLGAEAPSINQHHTNWRLQAIRSLDQTTLDDLHYSVTVGISLADAENLKNLLLAQLKEFMDVAHASAQEDAYCFNLDFFRI